MTTSRVCRDRVSDDRAPGRAPSGPFDDRWPSSARTSAAPPSPGSAVGSRVREPGPSPVAQTRPGITPSPPDVVPQNGRRAARAPGAGAHPDRRHAHARSGGTVAAARTPDGLRARLVLLAGVIWRDRSARALRRRLVGQPEDGRRDRSPTTGVVVVSGWDVRRRRIRGWFVADDDRRGIMVRAPGLPARLPSINSVSRNSAGGIASRIARRRSLMSTRTWRGSVGDGSKPGRSASGRAPSVSSP